MSRYRGPRFKKLRRLGALPGLTSKRPRSGSDLKNPLRSGKRSQYRIRLEEKQKLRFHYGLTRAVTGVQIITIVLLRRTIVQMLTHLIMPLLL